jgi:probable rRNA maturation factor
MAVFVANESGDADVDEVSLAALARFVLDAMRVNPLAELSVMLVETESMTDLHVRYMGEEGPTDVLAFPQDDAFDASFADSADADPTTLLGDVVLCPEVARAQADTAGHPAQRELHLLCTHGILHLLGYDHGEPAEEREMFGLQADLLTRWDQALAATDADGSAVTGAPAEAGTAGAGGGAAAPRGGDRSAAEVPAPTVADPDPDPDTVADPGIDAGSESGPGAGAGSGTDAGSGTGTGAGTDTGTR